MADIHSMPLRGHDLPLAADLRRMVRHKARVYKRWGSWNWDHDCGECRRTGLMLPTYDMAVREAVNHVKRCC